MSERIRVLVSGARGRMGREVVKAVLGDESLALVAAVDHNGMGEDAAVLAGLPACGVLLQGDLTAAIAETRPQVMVDFTNPASVLENVRTALAARVAPVVGTTGLSTKDMEEIADWAAANETGCLIAPNFAIGALLMMRFARDAARFFPNVEIIEYHHDQKLDAPSGTAIKTAELIREERQAIRQGHLQEEEKIAGSRGGDFDGMRIHSVRLPGLVAHQEVIFGALGQTLSIRHDSISRESFMPGVLEAIHRIGACKGLIYGLDKLIF
ncbi:4-hydroxy-tetrahydrodipicolinate reductase [Heliobacterium gestii]|uniref:4-hydroxy-tetrahydrodipicolinate reductase n=1 Tax=Heliomicrobium gestii TaxID=2699 RepID=A0A845LD14_HELGE|nr:4-hydroxy-tetrahydrodipicolinate reductase [Heliomicrobium gestii]MBM7868394.1 4-hydroxy-tetrahydrodipicolinate reductase [Heliomicrobium gestii]MZP44552.1 4-hydroxy-tetrahydrodipicolinate reductase [Heliomicrobium gestii]